MNILAIDPATATGWATSIDGVVTGGTWDLKTRRDESGGMKLIRFRSKLQEVTSAAKIGLVVFEAARSKKYQGALVVQAELQGVIKMFCETIHIEYRGYSPKEIKSYITGNGNAGKLAVMAAVQARLGAGTVLVDDNHADALALLWLAQEEYGR